MNSFVIDSWNREFLIEFVSIYRKSQCLWNERWIEFGDEDARNSAYEELLQKLKEVVEDATKDTVAKTIKLLRTNFRRELKRILDCRRFGTEAGEYTLWYLEYLDFLCNSRLIYIGLYSSVEEVSLQDLSSIEFFSCSLLQEDFENLERASILHTKMDKEVLESWQIYYRGARKEDGETEFATFGRLVAEKLEKLDGRMSCIARKLINDVLYEAQMGTLDETTKIFTSAAVPAAHSPMSRPTTNQPPTCWLNWLTKCVPTHLYQSRCDLSESSPNGMKILNLPKKQL